jgi:hypothetical protein
MARNEEKDPRKNENSEKGWNKRVNDSISNGRQDLTNILVLKATKEGEARG